jgi:DNA-binding response OmpR family regulator
LTTDHARHCALIIDDDPAICEMIVAAGEMFGIRVLHANNCQVGVKVLRENLAIVKLVLLDYFMPGMQPVTCASAIRELAGNDISVVLFTAAVDPAERAAELNLGRWLGKPCEFEALRTLLNECVEDPE